MFTNIEFQLNKYDRRDEELADDNFTRVNLQSEKRSLRCNQYGHRLD